jgi:hypothetical protein
MNVVDPYRAEPMLEQSFVPSLRPVERAYRLVWDGWG